MGMKTSIALFLLLVGSLLFAGPQAGATEIRVTILYDNYAATDGGQADWGFSCLVETPEKIILFDTGARPDVLQRNVGRFGIDVNRIEMVVISHLHGDHAGGLEWILSRKRGLPVYLPAMAGDDYLEKVRGWGGVPHRVREARELCAGVLSTGEMPADFDSRFGEQALVFRTGAGSLVITGCAHPGILEIVRRVSQLAPGRPQAVLGGFHLARKGDDEVRAIIRELQAAGVERSGASHCTGDRAIDLLAGAFGDRFLRLGVGRVLSLPR